jgi:hypothetical protein
MNLGISTRKPKQSPNADPWRLAKTRNRYKGHFWLQYARQCRYQRFSARIIQRNRATGRIFEHFWPWRFLTQDRKALLHRGGMLLDACYSNVLVKFRLHTAFRRWLGAVERIMFLRDQGKAATELHALYETSYRIHAAWIPVIFLLFHTHALIPRALNALSKHRRSRCQTMTPHSSNSLQRRCKSPCRAPSGSGPGYSSGF